ncbi:MAG TPA: AI-2E family transporter, partial [Bacteroidetes bacterium]|nr:AI-2E family transporter [Bacteroidota bacterium]
MAGKTDAGSEAMSASSPVVSPLYRRIFLLTLTLIGVVIFIIIFPMISDLLIVLIISIVLTYVFKPGVVYLEHYGVHRVVSIVSIFVLGTAVIGVGIYFIIPMLVDQVVALIDQLKNVDFVELYADFIAWMEERMPGIASRLEITPDQASGWVDQVSTVGAALVQQSHKVVAGAVNIIILATIVPFMTFFFLRDGSKITK